MRSFTTILLISGMIGSRACAQSNGDLYHHVDSLIVNVLNYSNSKASSSPKSSLKNNPEPLIILDGFPTPKEKLKGLPMYYIANIELLKAGVPARSLYGNRARNGAIILTTKEN